MLGLPRQLKLSFKHEVAVLGLLSLSVNGLTILKLQFFQVVNQLEQGVLCHLLEVRCLV